MFRLSEFYPQYHHVVYNIPQIAIESIHIYRQFPKKTAQRLSRPRRPRGHADPQMIMLISGKQNETRSKGIHEIAHRSQGHGQQLLTRKAPHGRWGLWKISSFKANVTENLPFLEVYTIEYSLMIWG